MMSQVHAQVRTTPFLIGVNYLGRRPATSILTEGDTEASVAPDSSARSRSTSVRAEGDSRVRA